MRILEYDNWAWSFEPLHWAFGIGFGKRLRPKVLMFGPILIRIGKRVTK